MINITMLGTTCMVPTKDRNHQAVYFRYKSDGLLFDCGEGTQRQIKISGEKITKVTKIFISHLHGDHVLGIPGLIQSLGSSDNEKSLEIYGPKGINEFMKNILKTFILDKKIDLNIIEIIKKGKVFKNTDYIVEAIPLDHIVPCLGYSFIEQDKRKIKLNSIQKLGLKEGPILGNLQKGKSVTFNGKKIKPDDVSYVVKGRKISIISDTILCKGCYETAKDSDILICESSFTHEHEDKAKEYYHLTAREAGQIASMSNVKKLILTHISARYKDPIEIENDARTVFSESTVAFDFMKIKL